MYLDISELPRDGYQRGIAAKCLKQRGLQVKKLTLTIYLRFTLRKLYLKILLLSFIEAVLTMI
jgi:hypothetical protein